MVETNGEEGKQAGVPQEELNDVKQGEFKIVSM